MHILKMLMITCTFDILIPPLEAINLPNVVHYALDSSLYGFLG
jgi:hypothetical protein